MSEDIKPRMALANLALLGALWLGNTHQDFLNKGWMMWLAKQATIATGAIAVIGCHQRHQLTIKDYLDGIKAIANDTLEIVHEVVPVADLEMEIKRVVVEKFAGLPALDSDPSFAPLDALPILASYVIVAGKGQGKSQIFVYLCRRFRSMGAEIYIGDIHLNDTIEEYGEYFPGLPVESYATRDIRRILEMYRAAERELDARLDDKGRSRHPYFVAVEEYNTFASSSKLTSDEQDEVSAIVARVEDEGRKARVFNLITTKSLKTKRTNIDSTVFSQFHWLALQGAFDDPNTRFLDGLDRQAVSQRQKDIGGFAVAHFDGDSRTCEVFKLPTNKDVGEFLKAQSERLIFEERGEVTASDYLEQHRESIAQLLRDNPKVSKTAIAQSLEGFGKRSADNPKWVELDKFLEQLKADIAAESQEVTEEENPFQLPSEELVTA